MLPVDFDVRNAFEPLAEEVKWTEDAYPHKSGIFRAVVCRGTVDTDGAAGVGITGDVWTLNADTGTALCAGIRVGDTVERLGVNAATLTVQKTVSDDGGWWIICTAAERSPM